MILIKKKIAKFFESLRIFGTHLGFKKVNLGPPEIGKGYSLSGGKCDLQILPKLVLAFDSLTTNWTKNSSGIILFDEVKRYQFSNVTILRSPMGLWAISENGCVIPGNGFHDLQEDLFFQTRFKIPRFQKVIENAFLLESSHSGNYYHWCVDNLPILYFFSDFPDLVPILLERDVQKKSRSFNWGTLFSNSFNQPHFFTETLLVKNFYCVSGLYPLPGIVRPEPLQIFWEKFHKKRKCNKLKLYITRGNANRRLIENEYLIIKILEEKGFRIVDPSSLSIREQINIFGQASIIIGPHGGALTNIIHCSPGTSVIEIFGPSFIFHHYEYLAKIFNLNYRFIQVDQKYNSVAMNGHCKNFKLTNNDVRKICDLVESL